MLDPSSATELLAQVPGEGKLKEQEGSRMRQSAPSPRHVAPAEYHQAADGYCRAHPEEEAKYFCFDCMVSPVCSECVIHGSHKGHDAQHVKQALPVVKAKLESVAQELSSSVEDLEAVRSGVAKRRQIVASQADEAKSQSKIMFDDLRMRIDKTERDVMSQIDLAATEEFKELDAFERGIEEKLAAISRDLRCVRESMSAGPIATLSFFASNGKTLSQSAGQEARGLYASKIVGKEAQIGDEELRGLKQAESKIVEVLSRLPRGTGRRKDAPISRPGEKDSPSPESSSPLGKEEDRR